MWQYYSLRFKDEAQWTLLKDLFKLGSDEQAAVFDVIDIWYEPSYKGPKSTLFHVNVALNDRKLPEKLWPFVVKPTFIKASFNGAGKHLVEDPKNYEDVDDRKIIGPNVTLMQLAAIRSEPDFSKPLKPLTKKGILDEIEKKQEELKAEAERSVAEALSLIKS